ncbi:SdpI family protein [Corynebacterium sp. p3-SID1145]|uniref:SdpI family protein n=1 Tax=unclassified Corynebacterium TaxID=2624378 RepID=UPI0021A9AC37|nr:MULTISPECIES: SdpI family protein [unclassified Corynebacterium]MCT1451814.1 SdpI family protein [Corynebacterium sp. p3-SID1145]MCT1460911.1 SdpI family protein [Corynebacterium sp. p3-SID1140]
MTGVAIGVVFIVFALALLIPGLLAALGRLPGNNVVGLHVPEVRKDEEIWVQAHKVAGPYLILGGLALAFGAAFAFIADGWLWAGPVVLALVGIAAVAAAGNQGARAAKLFAQAKDAEAGAEAATAHPAPQVDLGALRNAARRADDR